MGKFISTKFKEMNNQDDEHTHTQYTHTYKHTRGGGTQMKIKFKWLILYDNIDTTCTTATPIDDKESNIEIKHAYSNLATLPFHHPLSSRNEVLEFCGIRTSRTRTGTSANEEDNNHNHNSNDNSNINDLDGIILCFDQDSISSISSSNSTNSNINRTNNPIIQAMMEISKDVMTTAEQQKKTELFKVAFLPLFQGIEIQQMKIQSKLKLGDIQSSIEAYNYQKLQYRPMVRSES